MWKKKVCPSCGEKVKDDWKFCPYCGSNLTERSKSPFENIFEEVEKEFKKFDKIFSFDSETFPKIKFKSFPPGTIISITLTGHSPPRVSMKPLEKPHLEEKLPTTQKEAAPKKKIRIPKVTEEPATEVKTEKDKNIIILKLPEVKTEEDIEIKKLENSVEVKAFAGDKAYFKLIPIPRYAEVTSSFKNGILTLEIKKI